MQPLLWGFEPLMDINGIQVVLHAFTWFVTYLFAGCILIERQPELESAILSMARRCVDQLRYWRIITGVTNGSWNRICNLEGCHTGLCVMVTRQDTILRRSVTELSRNIWLREEESNLRPTAPNAKRIAVCAFKVLVRRVLNHGCPRKSWTSVSCVSDSYSTVELLDN